MAKNKPQGDLTFGNRDPLLKEIYNDSPKEKKKEKRAKFSKIRNIIKNQKKKK